MPRQIDFSKYVVKYKSDTLDFPWYYMYFSSHDLTTLFAFLVEHPEIKRIQRLNLCNVGNNDAKSIADALKQNTTLTSLGLMWDKISNDGMQSIADALKQNTTLRSLDLTCGKISNDAAQSIADMLKQNTTLRSLDLICGEISTDAAQSIADALKQNTTLTSLGLGYYIYNMIGNDGAQSIEKVLKTNMIMMSLNPDYNFNCPLTDKDKKIFKKYREELLQHMDDRLADNPIGRKKANDALKDPTTLLGQAFAEENITVFGTTVWNTQSDINNQIMRFFHPQSPALNRERVFLDEEDILQNDCGL